MKLPGIKTGSIDTVINRRRVKWKPTSELMLVASESAADDGLPRSVVGNPRAADSIVERRSKPLAKESARIFVGYNVKEKPTWRSGEVYLLAFLLREKQLSNSKDAHPAFSFYVGVGAFASHQGSPVSSERSAQIVFINFGQNKDEFFNEITQLAEEIAKDLAQESVLIELTQDGNAFYTQLIEPGEISSVKSTKKFLDKNAYRISKSVYAMK